MYILYFHSLHLYTLVPDSLMLVDDTGLVVTTPPPHYLAWLQDVNTHMEGVSTSVLVSATARPIQTPLVIPKWTQALQAYPLKSLAAYFLTGITSGFRICYNHPRRPLKSIHKNLEGALLHPEVVKNYLAAEVLSHQVAGPYDKNSCPGAHISRFGVIPKRHQKGKWRLIIDLSYPKLHSVNDGVPKHLCSLTYVTVDDAITKILESGQDTLLAKVDIKHAFRLLPVHPADRHLLTMEWKQSIYIDTCLPFGLRSALKLFNILADLLSWVTTQQGVTFSMHYLDDFLMFGPPDLPICQHNLNTFT